jgi:tripeptidyl-peptidase-1
MPQFPASCPYITTVGGTQATTPEVAWVFKQDNYTGGSSGGFSNYFDRPTYQNTAVRNYLSSHISAPTKKYYTSFANFAGRGYPDISAHSDSPSYQIFIRGKMSKSGGTSAAAPAVAGIIALLNDARLRAGKPALGWINPLLYAIGQGALNDITSGGSAGCTGFSLYGDGKAPLAGAGVIPYASWNATEGWDPVTGLGTPNFQALKNLVLSI